MEVTKVEYQKKDPNRVNLYIDEIFFCGISLETLAGENLYEGLKISQEVLDRIVKKDLERRFFTRATDYLSYSPRTEFQVRRFLKNLKYKKKDVWFKEDIYIDWEMLFNSVLKKLKKYKYIDDEKYARSFVSSRLRNRPRGKRILISELISKGVSKDIALRVCEEEVGEEYKVLKDTFQKRFKGKTFNIDNKKMVGYLLRKGFSWDLIMQLKEDESSE
jgi:regulatory protein